MSESTVVDLLFLNGWSLNSSFVEPFVQSVAGNANYQILDIDARFLSDSWMEDLAALVNDDTLIMGWSLGGMLAIRLAAFLERNQRGYRKLITLMAAPSFVSRESWLDGMSKAHFAQFKAAAEFDPLLIKTFPYLMLAATKFAKSNLEVRPSVDRSLLSELKKRYRAGLQDVDTRMNTLRLLEELNLRQELVSLSRSAALVFGQDDQLISLTSVGMVQDICPQHDVLVVEGEAHLLSSGIMRSINVICTLSKDRGEVIFGG